MLTKIKRFVSYVVYKLTGHTVFGVAEKLDSAAKAVEALELIPDEKLLTEATNAVAAAVEETSEETSVITLLALAGMIKRLKVCTSGKKEQQRLDEITLRMTPLRKGDQTLTPRKTTRRLLRWAMSFKGLDVSCTNEFMLEAEIKKALADLNETIK